MRTRDIALAVVLMMSCWIVPAGAAEVSLLSYFNELVERARTHEQHSIDLSRDLELSRSETEQQRQRATELRIEAESLREDLRSSRIGRSATLALAEVLRSKLAESERLQKQAEQRSSEQDLEIASLNLSLEAAERRIRGWQIATGVVLTVALGAGTAAWLMR